MKTEDPEALLSELVRRLPYCARNIEEEYPLWAAALDNLSHRSSDALCTLRQRVEAAKKMAEAIDGYAEALADTESDASTFDRAAERLEQSSAAFRATGGEG